MQLKVPISRHWEKWVTAQFCEQTGACLLLSAEVHQPALTLLVNTSAVIHLW